MDIINLGGYGGCTLTEVIKKFNQPRYPFDWNVTTQNFVIRCILTNGEYYFSYDDDKVFETTILLSKNNDAYLCHDFTDWNNQKQQVILKYKRRLDRLFESINSKNNILFCRHIIDKDPYNNYKQSQLSRIPFTCEFDEISEWENFMDNMNRRRNSNTKLILFTNNPFLQTTNKNIFICYNDFLDVNVTAKWMDISYNFILEKINENINGGDIK